VRREGHGERAVEESGGEVVLIFSVRVSGLPGASILSRQDIHRVFWRIFLDKSFGGFCLCVVLNFGLRAWF
jgi:hypothetical protein